MGCSIDKRPSLNTSRQTFEVRKFGDINQSKVLLSVGVSHMRSSWWCVEMTFQDYSSLQHNISHWASEYRSREKLALSVVSFHMYTMSRPCCFTKEFKYLARMLDPFKNNWCHTLLHPIQIQKNEFCSLIKHIHILLHTCIYPVWQLSYIW